MQEGNKEQDIIFSGLVGASSEVVNRYGSAVKEHLVAYSGVDNEKGQVLVKGLKQVAQSKINPDYVKQNLKQQAGFSAEIKEIANTNAKNIINKSDIRKIRTDDLGSKNDPLFDFKMLNGEGNVIPGSETQMKFVGATPKEALRKLASKKFEKYLEHDAKLEVPSDFYEGIHLEADKTIANLREQLDKQVREGNVEQIERLQKQLKKYEDIKKNLRKSTVSNKEAMFAREHPLLSTVKDSAKIAHGAGLEAATNSAVLGGSVSIVRNLADVVKGNESAEDAFINVTKDTATSAAVGYATGFAGSAVKGAMQNAGSSSLQALSKTNFPATVVNVSIAVGKTMKKYFSGDMTGVECMEELGEQGTGMLSAAMFSAIGNTVCPVIGGMVGGMLGYAVASASYGILMNALKDADLTHEERIQIEKTCEEHINLIKIYRLEMETMIQEHLKSHSATFYEAFNEVKISLDIGDVDGFILGANRISAQLGKKSQFSSFDEFDALMESDNIIKI